MATLTRILAGALCISCALPAQSPTESKPVAEVANVRFHSDVLLNLHHTLFAAAWARRPEAASGRGLAGKLPAPLDGPLTDEERAAWDAAVDHYDQHIAPHDLLFGQGMEPLKIALIAGDLDSPVIGRHLRAILESAMAVYLRHFWPAHDRVNRAWIAATVDRMKQIAPETVARLEKLYEAQWFPSPVRADIVWVGSRLGAFTSVGPPPHATISSGDMSGGGWAEVETVFHEFSHVLILPIQARIARSLGDRIREHGVLWHVVQFYLTGAAVQEVLKGRGIDHEPYMYATGLFDRAWGRYRRPVETNWEPYLQGKVNLDDAIAGTLKMLDAAR